MIPSFHVFLELHLCSVENHCLASSAIASAALQASTAKRSKHCNRRLRKLSRSLALLKLLVATSTVTMPPKINASSPNVECVAAAPVAAAAVGTPPRRQARASGDAPQVTPSPPGHAASASNPEGRPSHVLCVTYDH
jgi:hypothetical protein